MSRSAATYDQSISKMIQLPINELLRKYFHSINRTVFQLGNVGQLRILSLIVLEHCISYMIIHWHINLVQFLLFLLQNLSLIRKIYIQNMLHVYGLPESSCIISVNLVTKSITIKEIIIFS